MTNMQTISGVLAMLAMSCLMMLGALEPVTAAPKAAVQANHAVF